MSIILSICYFTDNTKEKTIMNDICHYIIYNGIKVIYVR